MDNMANKQATTQKASPSNDTPDPANGGMSAALRLAHEKRRAQSEERKKLPEAERIAQDVTRSVQKAEQRLVTGRGSVAGYVQRYRGKLSAAQKERIMQHLEARVAEVRQALYGRTEDPGFNL